MGGPAELLLAGKYACPVLIKDNLGETNEFRDPHKMKTRIITHSFFFLNAFTCRDCLFFIVCFFALCTLVRETRFD